MKKILFLVFVSYTLNLSAQETNHVISISPIGFVNKARIKYEKPLTDNFSIGTFVSYYYLLYKGLQIAPVARYYVNGEAPEGFYLQLKGVMGIHNRKYTVTDPATKDIIFEHRQEFTSFGAGFGLGYQILAGTNNNIVIDFGLGAKYMTPVPNPNVSSMGATFLNAFDNTVYYSGGPGSFFDGLIAVGVAF